MYVLTSQSHYPTIVAITNVNAGVRLLIAVAALEDA